MSFVMEPTRSIEVFYSYAHKDERLRNELDKHLSNLKRQGIITGWYDRDISAGREWEHEIGAHLNSACIILLLISPDYMAADYCYSIEMKRALARHEAGAALVIPVILRPCDWQNALSRKLQALPTDGKPITGRGWHNRDEAFLDVVSGIRKAIEKLRILKEQRLTEGHALYKAECYEEALAAYEKAISLNPNYAFAHYNEGVLLYNLERYAQALACFERAIYLDPRFVGNYIYKARVLERLGRLHEAIEVCKKYLQLPSNDEFFDFKITFQEWLETQQGLETHRLEIKNLEQIYEAYNSIRDKPIDENQEHELLKDFPDLDTDFVNQVQHELDLNQDLNDGLFNNVGNQDLNDWEAYINQEPDYLYDDKRQYNELKHSLEIKLRNIKDLKDFEAKYRAAHELKADCHKILDLLDDARQKLENKDREAERLQNACNTILAQLRGNLQLRYDSGTAIGHGG